MVMQLCLIKINYIIILPNCRWSDHNLIAIVSLKSKRTKLDVEDISFNSECDSSPVVTNE